MSENLFVIDESTSEGGKSIVVNEEKDFIQLCKITKYVLSDDQKYIDVEVTNDRGKTCSTRFYLPKEESEYADEKKYKTAVRIFLSNMANVGRKFRGADYKVEGKNALDVANKVITAITPSLGSKKLYTLFELTENDKGIFTRIGAFSPFAEKAEDLSINPKQKELLHKRSNSSAKPDVDFLPSVGGEQKSPF